MDLEPPTELGRGVVVSAGTPVPGPWAGSPRLTVGPDELADPGPVVEALHGAWAGRRPVVVELAVDPGGLRDGETCDLAPYRLDPGFTFTGDRLQFLLWANNYDARNGPPVWWHGRKAARRWADRGVTEGGPADLLLADGSPLYVDGGPPHPPRTADGVAVVHRWNAEAGELRPAGHGEPASDLAPDQLAAVTHRSGPARVIAPAGSGKTRVLTERLRHVVVDRGNAPGTVTALAYNTRAADELRERCADFAGPGGPHLRTLNSLGLAICNEAEGSSRLQVVDEPQVRDLVQQVFEVRRAANTDTVAPYLDGLSAIRLGLVTPEDAEAEIPDAAGLADGFDRYRALLRERHVVDFDEQIYRAVEILLTSPGARERARRRCRTLLVDEFQDLAPAHLLLIRLLAAPAFDCFGVGDDDQVIYGYAGADPRFLIHYDRYFPGATGHALEVNYRCPVAVVEAASHLLSYNHDRVPKTIRPSPAAGREPVSVRLGPGDELATLAVATIAGWLAEGTGPGEIALLARVNSALLPVQVACAETGIPCTTPLGPSVLRRTGIRTALAYLRIGADPGRITREDVLETVRRPSRGIAPKVVDMLTGRPTTSLTDIRRLARRLTGRDAPKVEAYADDLATVAEACGGTTAEALRAVRQGIGLDDTMDALDATGKEADRSTHVDDLISLESVAGLHPEPADFEAWLRSALQRPQPDGPCVTVSTVHRIKGREWEDVIVLGASEGSFPHRLSRDEDGERRVFHVAVTRARRRLVVLGDAAAPSVFVAELDGSRPRPTAGPGPASRRDRSSGAAPRTAGTSRSGGAPAVAASPAEEALRRWRKEAAIEGAFPAYVILKDAELVAVAERNPRTLRELARCPGMGPVRLDRWGDEILAVLAAAGAD